jgi:hypothetical protein
MRYYIGIAVADRPDLARRLVAAVRRRYVGDV